MPAFGRFSAGTLGSQVCQEETLQNLTGTEKIYNLHKESDLISEMTKGFKFGSLNYGTRLWKASKMTSIKRTINLPDSRFSGRYQKIFKKIFVHYSENQRDEYLVLQGIFGGVIVGAMTTSFDHSAWFNITCFVIAAAVLMFFPRVERRLNRDFGGLALIMLMVVIFGDPAGPEGWHFTLLLLAVGIIVLVIGGTFTRDLTSQPTNDT